MFLAYIDESGTGWQDTNTKFFCLGCFIISAEHWTEVNQEIQALKQEIFPHRKPDEWEIKGRDILKGEGVFKKPKLNNRLQYLVRFSQCISQLPCYILCIKTNKDILKEKTQPIIKDDNQLYNFTFNQLLEELDKFLKQHNTPGILFADSRSAQHTATQDRRLITSYQNWCKSRSTPSSLVELPWFGNSNFYIGLQLADYVTYLIARKSQESEQDNSCEEFIQAYQLVISKASLVEIPHHN